MAETVLSWIFLLLSCTYVLFARELSFGFIGAPKAGFLPMIAGIIAIILSLAIIIEQLLKNQADEQVKVNWRKFIFFIIGLVIYVIILKVAGYLVTSFVIMCYLLKVTETEGWVVPFFISAGVAVGFYFVFVHLLGVVLP